MNKAPALAAQGVKANRAKNAGGFEDCQSRAAFTGA
jgi:hypothetical protein